MRSHPRHIARVDRIAQRHGVRQSDRIHAAPDWYRTRPRPPAAVRCSRARRMHSPRELPKCRSCRLITLPSRHDYRIPALQQNVLLEVTTLGHLAVAETDGTLARSLAMYHANAVSARERSDAAGEAD